MLVFMIVFRLCVCSG